MKTASRTTLQLQNVNAFVAVPDHVEVVIQRMPRHPYHTPSIYRRLWRLLNNGATMDQVYLMIPSKRPALDLMRERLERELSSP